MNSESAKGPAEMAEFSAGLQTWQEELGMCFGYFWGEI